MLAKYNGKQVEFLPENGKGKGVPDLRFDGKTWDVKSINNANEETIRKHIEDARKSDNAIFYWKDADKLNLLKNAVTRSIGYFKKTNSLDAMPDIYYMNENGILKQMFKK